MLYKNVNKYLNNENSFRFQENDRLMFSIKTEK